LNVEEVFKRLFWEPQDVDKRTLAEYLEERKEVKT
jgi:hypothetical protein